MIAEENKTSKLRVFALSTLLTWLSRMHFLYKTKHLPKIRSNFVKENTF